MKVELFFEEHKIIVDGTVYNLRLVTPKELKKIRLSGDSTLLYKEYNFLWCIQFPKNSELFNSITNEIKELCSHKCCNDKLCCKNLSVEACPFVKDRNIKVLIRNGVDINTAYKYGMRIEKYPRITRAIQVFTLVGKEDFIKILSCESADYSEERKHIGNLEKQKLVLSIANYMYPHIESYSELRDFLQKN